MLLAELESQCEGEGDTMMMKTTFPRTALMALLCLAIPAFVHASVCTTGPPTGAWVCIDDITETMTGNFSGFDSGTTLFITQEGIGVLGNADFHGEYTSTDPNAPGLGVDQIFNYNMIEPGSTNVSDTLTFTLTGLGGGLVSVDLSFFSDSLDGIPPVAIPSGINVGENNVFHPLSDLAIAEYSTPEPGTLVMFGSGILGLAGMLRRKLKV